MKEEHHATVYYLSLRPIYMGYTKCAVAATTGHSHGDLDVLRFGREIGIIEDCQYLQYPLKLC